MTQLRIVPLPLDRIDKLAQDAQDRHDCLTEMLAEELEREGAEMVSHPLFPSRDYPLANLGLVEERQWAWLADNWRRWARRLAGMIEIAAIAALIVWRMLCR